MLQRLFDSPVQLVILLVVILLLFGASRLPTTARQLGRSMRIFRSEMKEMKAENPGRERSRDDADRDADRDADGATSVEALEGRIVDARGDHRVVDDRLEDRTRVHGDTTVDGR